MATQVDHSGLLHEASSQMLVTQWDGFLTAPPVFAAVGITPELGSPLLLIQTHDRQGLPKPNAVVYITFTGGADAPGPIVERPADTTPYQGYVPLFGAVYSTWDVSSNYFGGIIAAQPSNAGGTLADAQTITHAVTANANGIVALQFTDNLGTPITDVHVLISSGGADIDVDAITMYTGVQIG